jgi:hypothetical protein
MLRKPTFEEAAIVLLGLVIAASFGMGAHLLRHPILPYFLLCASILFGTVAALGAVLILRTPHDPS